MKKREARNKLLLLSCMAFCLVFAFTLVLTVERSDAVPAKAGGADAGSAVCKECHPEIAAAFGTNIHSKGAAYGYADAGCESCHGPGEAHASSGDKSDIRNPARLAPEGANASCLDCHSKTKGLMFWHGSTHEGYSCLTCHKVHGSHDKLLAQRNENDLCVSCHLNVRADLFKRSRHPMRDTSSLSGDGKMTCSSCHNAHGARAEKMVDAKSFNDKCYECHFEKRAPLLWEHSPVKEDCLTCHSAHGSSNDKMLVTMVPRLCQQCHMQGRHQSGTLSQNSIFAVNRGCLNCHSQIHGSNNPSGVVLQK